MYIFCTKSLEVACLLVLASLLCAKGQDPEAKAIEIFKKMKEFEEINMVRFSSEERKVVSDAVTGNTELSTDDLQSFDLVFGATYASRVFSNSSAWIKEDDKCRLPVFSPKGSHVVSGQEYFEAKNATLDQVCSDIMVDIAGCLKEEIQEILKSKPKKTLLVGVERIALQLEGKILLYTVMFFTAM